MQKQNKLANMPINLISLLAENNIINIVIENFRWLEVQCINKPIILLRYQHTQLLQKTHFDV